MMLVPIVLYVSNGTNVLLCEVEGRQGDVVMIPHRRGDDGSRHR
jgi:hypothetical protein